MKLTRLNRTLKEVTCDRINTDQYSAVKITYGFSGLLTNWSFDYFPCNAAKRPLRGRFAAYLILAPIFSKSLAA
jgi:hypothetical protein